MNALTRWFAGCLVAGCLPALAQVYSTLPQFTNPVRLSGGSTNQHRVTLASGGVYLSTNRPTESGASRFKIDSWTAGMPISANPPDFNIGDVIPAPPLADPSQAPIVSTTNGAFYMAARRQLVASQAGSCTVAWKLTTGATNTITYSIGALPTLRTSRLFWTDDTVAGAVNTNLVTSPDHPEFAVSLSGLNARIRYNATVPDFSPSDSQLTPAGQASRANTAAYYLDRPAVWIDGNGLLRARGQSGFLIVEYFDTSTFDNSTGYEIVFVGPARVYQSRIVLGQRLLPNEGADLAADLVASLSKAGDYVTQWTTQGSHFESHIFATASNAGPGLPDGDASKTQILWQRRGTLGVLWPYEAHWYGIRWPGDQTATPFVFDPSNPSAGPTIRSANDYTAGIAWSEKNGRVLVANSAGTTLSAAGEGRALVQYQNAKDVWFFPVRVIARTNAAYVSNQETFWPMGVPLKPVAERPRLMMDGAASYMSFYSDVPSGFTAELWIRPVATTNNASLLQILDYPQQAAVQAVLSLTNALVRLACLGSSSPSVVTSVTSTNSIPAGVWSHIAFTKSSSGVLQLFVNGVPDSTNLVTYFNGQTASSTSFGQVMLGRGSGPNGAVGSGGLAFFNGEIGEARIWGSALPAATLQSRMSATLQGSEPDLLHLVTPAWIESRTPNEAGSGAPTRVLDLATGQYVSAYGSAATTGPIPYQPGRRLAFASSDNWAEVPVSWGRSAASTVEMWYMPGAGEGWQPVLQGVTSSATNLSVGFMDGHVAVFAGVPTTNGPALVGSSIVAPNTPAHVAVSSSSGVASIYVDGTLQGTVTLPNNATIATSLVLGRRYSLTGAMDQRFAGKFIADLNVGGFNFFAPNTATFLSKWDAPRNVADNFARRIRGLFVPTVTGRYAFYEAADDASKLYISPDASPAGKRLIHSRNSWGSPDVWSTASDTVDLVAGTPYYIEQLHEEYAGGDNASATFSIVSNSEAAPASGTPTRLDASNLVTPAAAGAFEISDLRFYNAARSATEIANDRISNPDFSDAKLVRSVAFDRFQVATASGEAVLQVPDAARGYAATYHGAAALGTSLPTAYPGDEIGGIVRTGTAYHPGVYAKEGRILPVNATTGTAAIEVWWPVPVSAPYLAQPLMVPGMVSRYRLCDPLGAPVLAIAGQDSEGFNVPAQWNDARLYYQNDATAAGFNPNEEHALLTGSGTVYAIRWDLNSEATSRPFVLLEYHDPAASDLTFLQPIRVVSTNAPHPTFNRPLLVGQLLQAPKPLVDLPPSPLSGPLSGGDPFNRLYQDRRANWWARSAATPSDSVPSRWFYPLQPGFHWPSSLGAKAVGDPVPFGDTNQGMTIQYTISWPPVVPVLALGQTLSDATPSADGNGYLPAISGQSSVEILYDPARSAGRATAVVLDPSTPTTSALATLAGINTATDVRLGKTYFTQLPPHLRERVTWDPVAKILSLSGAIVRPVTGFPYVLPAWLGTGSAAVTDYGALAALSSAPSWTAAVDGLRKASRGVTNAETPFTDVVLSPTGTSGGYMTLGMNTRQALNLTGEPVSLYPVFVDTNRLYTGAVVVLYSSNPFDEFVTLRHTGDFGGDPTAYQFEWRYSEPVEGQVPGSSPATWVPFASPTAGLSRIIFGGPGIQTLKDQYFSARWRCTSANSVNTNWSAWTAPAFVQSWLTRAMDGINPFEQRVDSLVNNHVDLKTSILSQAGRRYMGSIPLNVDAASSSGLIETYETLLQRARNLSIDAGYSDADVNATLLESASKLNDLYALLGDEALSDAQDPTIAWGSRDLNDVFFGSRASSLFAFQGIVPSLLEEELALLRGIDDTTSTPVTVPPVYNRLYWNFTKGISAGEPAYALNYGIPSLVGDEKGSITEADAAVLYPQGHGDALGHYLAAIKGYYRLLANTNFTWAPRAGVKSIGGTTVTFDYQDERRMASTALQLARVADEVMERTHRRDFKSSNPGTALFADSNTRRAWSASDWGQRSSQGILYHWATLQSLLPAANASDSPQSVTRATVPEIAQMAGIMKTIQDRQDAIDRGDSPMGVHANVVPFDIDPARVDAGQGHFEQAFDRALVALQSAYAVHQRASMAAANLRRQAVSLESVRLQVEQREAEFNNQLIDLYGTPYPSDIGPVGAYKTGYDGPDLYHFNYIDRDLFDPADVGGVRNVTFTSEFQITGDSLDTLKEAATPVTYRINMDGIPVLPDSWTGQRAAYGKLQAALGDYIRAWVAVRAAVARAAEHKNQLSLRLQRLRDHNSYSDSFGGVEDDLVAQQDAIAIDMTGIENTLSMFDSLEAEVVSNAEVAEAGIPDSTIVGLAAGGDLSFPAIMALAITRAVGEITISYARQAGSFALARLEDISSNLDDQIADNQDALAAAEEQSQTVFETGLLLGQVNADKDTVYGAVVAFRQAWQQYVSLVDKGNRLQRDLLAFRQSTSSRIQEARYADIIFRVFKNEDLAEYRNAFEQAARYVFAAARVYDYETGLLDPDIVGGRDGDFIGETMRATQLGDLLNGQPVPGSRSSGTLASVMARMKANWSVLKGRFGINNPARDSHRISLRQELFRIGRSSDPIAEARNIEAWQNKLNGFRVPDIRAIPEFKALAQAYTPMAANEPALVIPFGTQVAAGRNLFGLPLAGGDTALDSSQFTTKIRAVAIGLEGYQANLGGVLGRTPRAYLLPAGTDLQRMPISAGAVVRSWRVVDQVWPIPYPAASGNVSIPPEGFGTENVHVIRRFPPMRAYDSSLLGSLDPAAMDSRLVGRSVWNTQWVLIIPGSSLSSSPSAALDSLVSGITDIHLQLRTYSHSAN